MNNDYEIRLAKDLREILIITRENSAPEDDGFVINRLQLNFIIFVLEKYVELEKSDD